MEHTIESLASHPRNIGNLDRDITIGSPCSGDWMYFVFKNISKESGIFRISRQAAEELLVALDLLLSEDGE